mmetsp:Transcript_76438/g.145448  ORF Transcript_76438/g.145448 Transcript_76438/m.145448 type:complete len:551 (-) Transcript_76438:61-1713(-)
MGGCQGGSGSGCANGPQVLLASSDVPTPELSARRDDAEEYEKIEPDARNSLSNGKKGGSVFCQQLSQEAREQFSQLSNALENNEMAHATRLLLKKVETNLAELEDELCKAGTSDSHWTQLLDEEDADENEEDGQARAFLLQNFTTFQPDIAESSHVLDAGYPQKPRHKKRDSTGGDVTNEALRDQLVINLLANAGTFDFDAIKFRDAPAVKQKPLRVICTHLMEELGLFDDIIENVWVVEGVNFATRSLHFLGVMDESYNKEAVFHGSHHAADCVSTVEWFMHLDSIRLQTHALDHFMSIMSAAIHDVGHPGTNNLFETKTMSALAVRYNDSSILENYHVSLACETMLNDQECNWFELLPKEHRSGGGDGPCIDMQQYIRRGLIEMVLSTDMARHSDHVQQLKDLLTKEEEEHQQQSKGRRTQGQKQESLEKKLFILKTVLHAADISNPCKPKEIMLGWCDRVLQEFWYQGDEEKKLNLPISPLCDRESGMGIVPKGQCGFIKFVIQPFFQAVVELMPEAEDATDELGKNFVFWTSLDQKGATYEQIFRK